MVRIVSKIATLAILVLMAVTVVALPLVFSSVSEIRRQMVESTALQNRIGAIKVLGLSKEDFAKIPVMHLLLQTELHKPNDNLFRRVNSLIVKGLRTDGIPFIFFKTREGDYYNFFPCQQGLKKLALQPCPWMFYKNCMFVGAFQAKEREWLVLKNQELAPLVRELLPIPRF